MSASILACYRLLTVMQTECIDLSPDKPDVKKILGLFSRLEGLRYRLEQVFPHKFAQDIVEIRRASEGVEKKIKSIVAPFFSSTVSSESSLEEQIAYFASKNQRVNFSSNVEGLHGWLANPYPCSFEFGGITYQSATAAYEAQKFSERFRSSFSSLNSDQAIMYSLQHQTQQRLGWYEHREETMLNILRAKFGQNPALQENLRLTLKTSLVAEIEGDEFWGASGNRLGQLLMQVRYEYGGAPFTEDVIQIISPGSEAYLGKSLEEIQAEIEDLNRDLQAQFRNREFPVQTQICRMKEHQKYNRANDCNYVYDSTLFPLSSKKYINANWVFGKQFIATQAPQENTSEEFWHMILEGDVGLIAMLNLRSDYPGSTYYPEKIRESKTFGNVSVALLKEPVYNANTKWRQSPDEEEVHGWVERSLEVVCDDQTKQVTHFQYLNWRDYKTPQTDCFAGFIQRIGEVQGAADNPLVVHCLAGVGRTGVFMAVYREWKKGDPFDVKANVAEQRDPAKGRFAGMVQSVEQYVSCYKVLEKLSRLQAGTNCKGATSCD